MAQPRILILRAPGTNCDLETAFAFKRTGGQPERIHVNRLLEKGGLLADFQILCLPGGFSYGDDLGAGRILGTQIQHRLADCCQQFKAAGKLILGICNGFQILMRTGLLLAPEASENSAQSAARATLTWNQSGRFEDRWVHLDCVGSKAVLFAGIDSMYLPVAHAEGKFVTRDSSVLADLERSGPCGAALSCGRRPRRGLLPRQSEWRRGQHRRHLRPHRPGVRLDAASGASRRRHAASALDPRPAPAAGDGLGVFQNAVGYFR